MCLFKKTSEKQHNNINKKKNYHQIHNLMMSSVMTKY